MAGQLREEIGVHATARRGPNLVGILKRREFITFMGGVSVAWTMVARAETAIPVIGYLSGWSPGDAPDYLAYFRNSIGLLDPLEVHSSEANFLLYFCSCTTRLSWSRGECDGAISSN
jgi:hypothetical protein